jgi:hypothetical protein
MVFLLPQFKSELWIRNSLNPDPDMDPDPAFQVYQDMDPDPNPIRIQSFDNQLKSKKLQLKIVFLIFFDQNCNLLIPRPP